MKVYNPNPIDTSRIELPKSIQELIEKLAENTHDIWARQRIKEGWTYGELRDDQNLKHPCLVPYRELKESERDYDRNTAIETLKFIISSGFAILPK